MASIGGDEMEVNLKFVRGEFARDVVTIEIKGPPKQVQDIVDTIRNRIKKEPTEKKERWEYVWRDFEEV